MNDYFFYLSKSHYFSLELIVLFIVSGLCGFYFSMESFLVFLLLIGPLAFGAIYKFHDPILVSQIFYLCPLDFAGRKEYFCSIFRYQICFPLLLGIPGMFITFVSGYTSLFFTCILVINLIIICFNCVHGINHYFSGFLAIATTFSIYISLFYEKKTYIYLKLILCILTILIQIPYIFLTKKEITKLIEKESL